MPDTRTPSLEDLATPALLLDLDRLEANLEFMRGRAESLGVRLRPHIKTHKCLEIARMQRTAGAAGITVSTLEEARVFAREGFDDITWAFPLNPGRMAEVTALSDVLGVTVESTEAVEALEDARHPFAVWLEVDCGYGRTGVDPRSELALALAHRIAGSRHLRLAGCLTHSGHAYHADSPERIVEIAEEERRVMVEFGARLREAGVGPGVLSVGSTPAMSLARSLEGVDEARPGNYALYDYTQARLGACDLERPAVTVLSTVISSRPAAGRSVSDAGALVLSKDLGPDSPPHYGRVYGDLDDPLPDGETRVVSVSQEHAILSAARPVGSRVRILPNHACLTVAQFDHFTVVRGNRVTDRWKIWRARGPGPEALERPGDA